MHDEQVHVLSVSSCPFLSFTALSCLVEDAFVRRNLYSSVFADLTSLKHLSYIKNLDYDEDGSTDAESVSAFDTSRLGLWLSVLFS